MTWTSFAYFARFWDDALALGSGLPRILSSLHAGGPGQSHARLYGGGMACGEGLLGFLWHEYVHNQLVQ